MSQPLIRLLCGNEALVAIPNRFVKMGIFKQEPSRFPSFLLAILIWSAVQDSEVLSALGKSSFDLSGRFRGRGV